MRNVFAVLWAPEWALAFSVVFGLWVGSYSPAFASKNMGSVDIAPARTQSALPKIKLAGNLGCDSGRVAARLGLPCSLMVEDLKTGRIYGIETESADQSRLFELYEAGLRNVAIEGSLTGSNTIRVSQAKGL